ncbi:phenylalanine--tRNA ligase subunit alpha [Candidatus Shapirobacteria bacterium]|nr:phenylalanine--tRNA ligase subunit alpha [Candidatus Shapirobacteria bacterium]
MTSQMDDLNKILTDSITKINESDSTESLEKVRIELLGRAGLINQLFSGIKTAPNPKEHGQELNRFKKSIEETIETKKENLPKSTSIETDIKIVGEEVSLPKQGHLHPITITERQINELFRNLGFSIYDGPEIETDEYCFQRLNVPSDHPAREMQDSIYINEPEFLLRTQTSSIEARLLAQEKPPFKAAFPGRVYRNEKVTKSNHFIFHQYQGVAVDKNMSLKDLLGVFNILFTNLYGNDVKVRYRCKYYPEVEPGVGLDLQCFNCHGDGCPVCKGAGWMEMGGAGIIHPKVLTMAGIDPTKWRGFAFGLGLDRWVMAKYQIKDIRTFLGGNLAYKPNEK